MRSKNLVVALLVVLALAVSGFTYAYWASVVNAPTNGVSEGTIQVGSGDPVTTSVTVTDVDVTGGNLVPATFAGSGEVESVPLSFTVAWNADALVDASLTGSTSTATLTVTPVVTVMDGLTDVTASVGSLVVVTADVLNASSITLGASAITISYTVTLTEPSTVALYNLIAGSVITIEFTFVVSSVVTA
jgi:hypothetical protein